MKRDAYVVNGDVEEKFYEVSFFVFSQQSFAIPVELQKAAAMFRKILAAELPPFHEGSSSNIRRLHNAQALIVLACVCRYWEQIFATSSSSSRQQLKRVFDC
jgi:hypothetical protein